MMTVAMNVLEDQHLAEDAVQSAFVSLFKNMGHVGEPDSTATKRYLVTITKNAAIDLYRKREKKMQREIYIDELGGEKSACDLYGDGSGQRSVQKPYEETDA